MSWVNRGDARGPVLQRSLILTSSSRHGQIEKARGIVSGKSIKKGRVLAWRRLMRRGSKEQGHCLWQLNQPDSAPTTNQVYSGTSDKSLVMLARGHWHPSRSGASPASGCICISLTLLMLSCVGPKKGPEPSRPYLSNATMNRKAGKRLLVRPVMSLRVLHMHPID